MPYVPRHQKQLNAPGGIPVPGRTKGSRDCGPRTVSMGIDFLTKGQKRPSMTEVRRRMKRTGPQQTNVYNARDCVESYKAISGRKPLRYYIKDSIGDVKSAVRAGKFVQCCIDYGMFNRLMRRTGDPYFTGGHSVGVLGQKRRPDGTIMWLLFDPLDDARRNGIPKGPRWVKREVIVKSMESFAKTPGRCYAGVFGGGQKR